MTDRLRVALDITARTAGMTGVARYAEQLERALIVAGVEVRRFCIGRAPQTIPASTRRFPLPLRLIHPLQSIVRMPRVEWIAPRADVIHTLDLIAPPTRRPTVITVHDLAAIEHPELHPRRMVTTQQAVLASLKNSSVVVVNSEATARELARHGVSEQRVVVTPLGLTPLPEVEPARLPGAARYVLCVGALAYRKGQADLLKAWAGPTIPGDAALVLVGPDGYGAAEIRALAGLLGLGSRVRFESEVSEERLSALYRGAAAVCIPSRAEGFGLPVLEAMALGVPVIASDLEAIREVAGDIATLVPAGDHTALAAELGRVLTGEGVDGRVAAGKARAAGWTWERCAALTIKAYELAIGG
ncbi:MAG TPA: glycosyltransferase family 1 protein [Acidimicrobiales bacterium]